MDKKVGALVVLLAILMLAVPAAAHPGKLDAYGGHRKTADGTYHYHLGSDRKVEYAAPPNGGPTRSPATPKPTRTPKPSKTPRPQESSVPRNPPEQQAEKEPGTAPPDGAVISPKPEPAAPAPLPSFYPMEEASPAPAAPFRIPLTKPFFVTLFVLGGLMTAFLLSFLIFVVDRFRKKQ